MTADRWQLTQCGKQRGQGISLTVHLEEERVENVSKAEKNTIGQNATTIEEAKQNSDRNVHNAKISFQMPRCE